MNHISFTTASPHFQPTTDPRRTGCTTYQGMGCSPLCPSAANSAGKSGVIGSADLELQGTVLELGNE